MFKKNLVFVSILVLLLALSGCQLFFKPTLDRLVITADAETVEQGGTVNLEVKGFDKNSKEMKLSKPTWSAAPENMGQLTVDGNKAVFTADESAEGEVTITVTSGGKSKSIKITITKPAQQVDKTALQSAIQEATQLKQSTPVGTAPGQAPQDAHDAFQAAIDAAQAVLDDEDATQAEVDSAVQALQQAKAAFEAAIVPEEPGQVDKDALIAAITESEDLLENTERGIYQGQVPVHAHHALETAVNDATAVEEDDDATQEDVDDAVAALEQAIAAFNAAIVTADDPIKALLFDVDGNKDHFATQPNRGTIGINTDPRYIVTGTESILCNAIGQPFYVRVMDTHPNWVNDWREYDHLAAWFWVESAASLNNTTAIQIGYPMNTAKITFARAEFEDGWNEIVVNLRDDLGLTDEQLSNMAGSFEFYIRYDQGPSSENPAPPVYFDAIRVLKLVETDPVDKSDLQNAIQTATTLKESTPVGTEPGQAPQTAHDALQAAINAAEAILNDEGATQAQVDNATQALLQAIEDFEDAIIGEIVDSDKTALIAAINEAEDLLANSEQGIYYGQAPVHAHGALQAAVNVAKAVNDDVSASQEEVDDATSALQQAIADFNSEIVTDPNPAKVHTYRNVETSSSSTISTEKFNYEANYDPQYIKMGEFSIKLEASGSPAEIRIRTGHPDRITDWSEYDKFSVWIYIDNVDNLNKDTAFQWVYGTTNVRSTLPRSAFKTGWNEIVLDLRTDLGFDDTALANMTDIFCLKFRFAAIPDTIYVDQIRLLKLEEAASADKEDLENAIQIATDLMQNTPVGTEPGQATQEAHYALQDAIDAAQVVLEDENATQAEVDSATQALLQAIAEFKAAIAEDPGDPPVDPNLILYEGFSGLDSINEFWSKDYKALPGTTDQPMYKSLGGNITLDNHELVLNGGRFSIGMPYDRPDTKSSDTEAGGTFDLTKKYRITVEFTEVGGDTGKKFQIYVDNNTTSAGNSIHSVIGSNASRLYTESLSALPESKVISVESTIGTDSSFIQLRVESNGIIR
ncbi:MAG TPA: hypothetical protein GX699_08455, partial [Firmicutes bacterium]|nr:hypothetical protein [Bacillota bacterium]